MVFWYNQFMQFSKPHNNLERLGLGEGQVVVDLGVGSGHYALAAAHMLGPDGRVYAVDVQQALLDKVADTAKDVGIQTIEIILGDIERPQGSQLADGIADVVLLCNTLFQLDDQAAGMAEAARLLRPAGKLLVVDWQESFAHLGPTPEQVVDKAAAEQLLAQAGFELEREINAGDHHYGLVARKRSS